MHSNGYSLVRKVVAKSEAEMERAGAVRQEEETRRSPADADPHLCEILPRRDPRDQAVKALAHITGGGFPDNIPRVLPKNLGAHIDLDAHPGAAGVPSGWPQAGGIAEKEMLRTFNCGIGMIAVVDARAADKVAAILKREGESVVRLGELVAAAKGKPRVTYTGRLELS